MQRIQARRELAKDCLLILFGAGIALALAQIGVISGIVNLFGGNAIAAFVAGLFFTSAFTIAPASVALAQISQSMPTPALALWGALGAMCGDLILFFFIRDRFVDDVRRSFKPSFWKHVGASFHLGFLKWIAPLVGALIIASPLPDEFGLTLMGISRTRLIILIPISFLMNMLGICALIWFAHAI